MGEITIRQPHVVSHDGARNSIYLFAMDSLAEDIRVEGLQKTVSKVQMVATGKPVAFTAAAGGIRIRDVKGLWSNGIPVIELRS